MSIKLAFGNRKLPKTTAIFNMTSATDCPSAARGVCKVADICYAKKAERIYPGCLPARRAQSVYWKRTSAAEFVTDFLEAVTYKAGAKRGQYKVTVLRLSEAGDFATQADLNKAVEIAEGLSAAGIGMYAYSAAHDFDYSDTKSLVVNGSGFMADNEFTAVNKEDVVKSKPLCPGDCTKCSLCEKAAGLQIQVIKH